MLTIMEDDRAIYVPLYSFFGPMWMPTLRLYIPYMTFMGQTLPNNSYVDVSLVGDPLSGGEGVQCHTDLTTCCSSDQSMDRGDWYAPDSEDRLVES